MVPSAGRAAALLHACAARKIECGRRAWRAPDVAAYRPWLEREAYRAADAGLDVPRPLRAAEEWLLWREAAASAAEAAGFEAQDRLADSLHRAALLLYEWNIAPAALETAAHAEAALLARALQQVEGRTHDLRAVARHRLASVLRAWRPPQPVTFAGFAETTAERRRLLDAWSAPDRTRGEGERGDVRLLRAGDAAEELELAASWCRTRLEHEPHERLLVVLPDLARRRSEVLRVFRRTLAPGAADSDLLAIEDGGTLGEEPLVRHALAALRFLLEGAETPELGAWLRAAFWKCPTAVERAKLEAALRETLGVDSAPPALLAALRGLPGPLEHAAAGLRASLEAALEALTQPPGAASPSEWARRFDRALRALGWPGERALTAREQQAQAGLLEALADLATLGAQVGSIGAARALRTIGVLAERRVLGPLSGDAAVTLAGELVDPIVRYDGIWIAGLHADAWPPPIELNPFIPPSLQRRAGIPAADGAKSLALARELLRRCLNAAPRIVASWPARSEQRELALSPLLAELRSAGAASETSVQRGGAITAAEGVRGSRRIETYADEAGDPWPALSPLPAGTRAIEYQSRCPFRAYAELRLGGAPLEARHPGISPLERGRLLHRALELLWDGLAGSRGLETESRTGALARRVAKCVERAAGETLPVAQDAPSRAAQRRERRRAERLLVELAALEGQRAPFRVRSLELRRRVEIAGATLELRIDRLDELADGSCAVFDYKTGQSVSVDWLAERVANPQLLVYALAAGPRVAAVAMIHLLPQRIAYRGMADRRERLPRIGAPPDAAQWAALVDRWREQVERLAHEFLQGRAAAEPLGDACATCHLHGFCRIADGD